MRILVLFVILLNMRAYAGDNKWTNTGPYGGPFRSFAFHPEINNLIFAASGYGVDGVFRSRNGGLTWERLDISGAGGYGFSVRIHPKEPGTIIAAGISVFSSSDQGSSWQEISRDPFRSSLSDLEFHSRNPQILYGITGGNGVFKSTDGGRTWSPKNSGLPRVGQIERPQVEVDPTNGNIVYVLTKKRNVYKTTNGGDSWNRSSGGLKLNGAMFLAIDPENPQDLYAGGWGSDVFKSTNGGKQWVSTNCQCDAWDLAVDAKDPQILYTSSGSKSTNGGQTWTPMNMPASIGYAGFGVAVHPKLDFLFFSAFGHGILRSGNGGQSWKISKQRLDALSVAKVVFGRGAQMFAWTGADHFLFESRNGGNDWEFSPIMIQSSDVGEIVVNPIDPNIIAAGDFLSTDAGRTWKKYEPHFNFSFSLVRFHTQDKNTLYAAINSTDTGTAIGMAKSTDLGKTWKQINSGLSDKTVYAIAVDPQNGSMILLGTVSGRIFKSSNGGAKWKNSSAGLSSGGGVSSIVIDPSDSRNLYATTGLYAAAGSVYKSTDGGRKWVIKSNGLQGSPNFVAIDPSNPRILTAGTFGGIFVSTDEAESWSAFPSNGLGSVSVHDFLVDPANPDRFLIGTDRGVFSYTLVAVPGAPVIEQLSPSAGKVGDTVMIAGRNFGPLQGTNKVLFGSVDAGAAQSWNVQAISVRVPLGAATGSVTVTVSNRKSNGFEFWVLPTSGSVEPTSGPIAGGTRVAILAPSGISGTQFNVLFGAKLAHDVGFTEPNIIKCTTPPGTGTVDVSVTSSAVVAKVGTFTYR